MAKRKRVARWNDDSGQLECGAAEAAWVYKAHSGLWIGHSVRFIDRIREFEVSARTRARARAMVEALVKLDGVEVER